MEKCPMCGSSLTSVWSKGRKLRQECTQDESPESCSWKGEPYTPEQRPIEVTKTISTGHSWMYEGLDGYGHTFTFSQGFGSEEEATTHARKELEGLAKSPHSSEYGKCVAIVWPPYTTVTGKLVSVEEPDTKEKKNV